MKHLLELHSKIKMAEIKTRSLSLKKDQWAVKLMAGLSSLQMLKKDWSKILK